jgi:RNA recognition motif-containing protein
MYFGSDQSLAAASKEIQKKLAKAFPEGETGAPAELPHYSTTTAQANSGPDAMDTEDRGRSQNTAAFQEEQPVNDDGKKRSGEPQEDIQPAKRLKTSNEENLSEPKPPQHKVKVGKVDYPAHPLTVRVFNLAFAAEDMDLVDTFRTKCGAVVHAKIMREKHHHGKGKSKGWGLVQFEERESVEKALALSDVIGIRERLVKVDRSHLPAVGLVPPGMHRVNPKGEGKSTKHNEIRKQQRQDSKPKPEVGAVTSEDAPKTNKGEKTAEATGAMSVLAFRPRKVQQSPNHRKVKVSLPPKTTQNDE